MPVRSLLTEYHLVGLILAVTEASERLNGESEKKDGRAHLALPV